jgi:hypothetical protein
MLGLLDRNEGEREESPDELDTGQEPASDTRARDSKKGGYLEGGVSDVVEDWRRRVNGDLVIRTTARRWRRNIFG